MHYRHHDHHQEWPAPVTIPLPRNSWSACTSASINTYQYQYQCQYQHKNTQYMNVLYHYHDTIARATAMVMHCYNNFILLAVSLASPGPPTTSPSLSLQASYQASPPHRRHRLARPAGACTVPRISGSASSISNITLGGSGLVCRPSLPVSVFMTNFLHCSSTRKVAILPPTVDALSAVSHAAHRPRASCWKVRQHGQFCPHQPQC